MSSTEALRKTRRQIFTVVASVPAVLLVSSAKAIYEYAAQTQPGWAIFAAVSAAFNAVSFILAIKTVGDQ